MAYTNSLGNESHQLKKQRALDLYNRVAKTLDSKTRDELKEVLLPTMSKDDLDGELRNYEMKNELKSRRKRKLQELKDLEELDDKRREEERQAKVSALDSAIFGTQA